MSMQDRSRSPRAPRRAVTCVATPGRRRAGSDLQGDGHRYSTSLDCCADDAPEPAAAQTALVRRGGHLLLAALACAPRLVQGHLHRERQVRSHATLSAPVLRLSSGPAPVAVKNTKKGREPCQSSRVATKGVQIGSMRSVVWRRFGARVTPQVKHVSDCRG